MNRNAFKQLFAESERALADGRLWDLLQTLGGLLPPDDAEHDSLRADYAQMLQYVAQGAEDPERENVYAHLLRRAARLLDAAHFRQLVSDDETSYFHTQYEQRRLLTQGSGDEAAFYRQYLAGPWSQADYAEFMQAAASDAEPAAAQLMAVSGLMMSLLQVFDARKLEALLRLCQSNDEELRVRALVGAVFAIVRHEKRLSLFPALADCLRELTGSEQFVSELQALQLQLLLSRQTRQDSERMRNEIMPEFLKTAEEMRQSGKFDITKFSFDEDYNPEWKNEESNLNKSVEALMALREKGADTTFAEFVGTYRRIGFFDDISHWFKPYDEDHLPAGTSDELRKMLRLIFQTQPLCNTDRFRLFYTLENLDDRAKQMIGEQMDQMQEHLDAAAEAAQGLNLPKTALRTYVQDIYRFFHLFRSRDDALNPFRLNLTLTDHAVFADALSRPESLLAFGNFSFTEKNYDEALAFFSALPEEEKEAEVYEKIGFCQYALGRLPDAAESFSRANLLKPESRWTLRKMSQTYFQLGDFDGALEALEQLEAADPENAETLLQMGECFMRKNQPDRAFEKLYKAHYLHPDGKALGALAWCSMLVGKWEQSEKHYAAILAASPTADDYFCAGLSAWLSGQTPVALDRFRRCLRLRETSAAPADFFAHVADLLERNGKTPLDQQLLRDALNSTFGQ